MNRRDFLKLCGLAMVSNSSLFAKEEIYISKKEMPIFLSINMKLNQIQRTVGYGNFNIISFDEALSVAKRYPKIGAFSKEELSFIEKMFYEDVTKYGFYGKQTMPHLTSTINKKDIIKIPHTGHYLFQGKSLKDYSQMVKDVDNIYLTSGIRSVVKQMKLYFNKIYSCNGNITQATYSLAPIGYSYHSVGDFDVGKRGWGARNFTAKFGDTVEFSKIEKLQYINIRYTKFNKDGIRYEPWHIQIV